MGRMIDYKIVTDALKILAINNNNFSKTSVETGISRPTLIKWSKKISIDAILLASRPTVNAELDAIAIETAREFKDVRKKFIEDALTTKKSILKKMNKLIPQCKNLDALARALKIVHEIDLLPGGPVMDINNKGDTTTNFIQIITEQLKNKSKEYEPDNI